jgi:hypothetical protein
MNGGVMTQSANEREILRIASVLRERDAFPLQDLDGLTAALGGNEATVEYNSRSYNVAKWGRLVPSYYFPIKSEKDFVEKARDAVRHAEGIRNFQTGRRLDQPPE